jgi:hypothetical protein
MVPKFHWFGERMTGTSMEQMSRQTLDRWGQEGLIFMLFVGITGGVCVCLFIAAAMTGIEGNEFR